MRAGRSEHVDGRSAGILQSLQRREHLDVELLGGQLRTIRIQVRNAQKLNIRNPANCLYVELADIPSPNQSNFLPYFRHFDSLTRITVFPTSATRASQVSPRMASLRLL